MLSQKKPAFKKPAPPVQKTHASNKSDQTNYMVSAKASVELDGERGKISFGLKRKTDSQPESNKKSKTDDE